MVRDMATLDITMTMAPTCIATGPGGLDTDAFCPRGIYAGLTTAAIFTLAVIGTVMGLSYAPTIVLIHHTTGITTNLGGIALVAAR
jgi:hypothetical protein